MGGLPPGEALDRQRDALRDCRECALAAARTQVVFGVGDPGAALMFVGEGPGFNEDRQGEPFVGAAGKLLTELLGSIGLRREDVYIANVVKCRPPENRDPLPAEIEACSPHLAEQVRTIRPLVICTLGRFATRLLGDTEASMSAVHGKAKRTEVFGVPTTIFPIFHPAAALYTPANRTMLEEDFQRLRRLLARGPDAPQEGAGPETVVPAPAGSRDLEAPSPPDAGGSGHPSGPENSPPRDEGPAEQLALW